MRELALALPATSEKPSYGTPGVRVRDRLFARIREARPDVDVAVVSNPEFLREGAAIQDFKHPDRIVIGIEDERARAVMSEIYRPLYLNQAPILFTGRRTAELVKYAANAYLATKITFINEMADLCERVGADVQDVARGIGLDADGAHVGAALSLGLDESHDLAHVLDARGARGAHGFIDQRVEFCAAQLGRHVALQQGDFRGFLVRQVRAIPGLELFQGFLALLDHLFEYAQHLRVVQGDAFIDFTLLDGSGDHADGAEPLLFTGAHRRLHIVGNSLFEGAQTATNALSTMGAKERTAADWQAAVRCRACSRGTGASSAV